MTYPLDVRLEPGETVAFEPLREAPSKIRNETSFSFLQCFTKEGACL